MNRALSSLVFLALALANCTPGGGADGGTDAGPDERGFCNVDFPCSNRTMHCVGERGYQRLVTHDCTFTCGSVPCSGATCDPEGPVMMCPAGTRCVDRSRGPFDDAGVACEGDDAAVDAAMDAADATDPDGGVDASPDVRRSCNVDFPCNGHMAQCVGTTGYQRLVTHDCTFTCGPGPCSGASCDPEGPVVMCPAGSRCVDRWRGPDSGAGAQCEGADAAVDAGDESSPEAGADAGAG